MDGQNPFRTTLKPWETTVCWYLQGIRPFQGFLGGAKWIGPLITARQLTGHGGTSAWASWVPLGPRAGSRPPARPAALYWPSPPPAPPA